MKTELSLKRRSAGFSLIEVMIGVGLTGALAAGAISFSAQQAAMNNKEKLAAELSAAKARIVATIASDSAWMKTLEMNRQSSNLNCIGSQTGCKNVSGSADFNLYETDGTLVYSTSRLNSFNLNGSSCNTTTETQNVQQDSSKDQPGGSSQSAGSATGLTASSSCPVRLQLQWRPLCAPSDANCQYPLIQVSGTFSAGTASVPLNLSKYDFTINRSSIQNTVCPTLPPSCPGEIAVCTLGGWTCMPPLPPYCQGNVNWNDTSTNFGPCTATFPAPGLLHDTVATATNTALNRTGSANILCRPGEPNNGFVIQNGATCAASAAPTPAPVPTASPSPTPTPDPSITPSVPTVYAALYSAFTESWNGSTYVVFPPLTATQIVSYSRIPAIGSACSAGAYGVDVYIGPTIDNMSCSFDYNKDPIYVYHRGTQTYSKLPSCATGTAPVSTGSACKYTATLMFGSLTMTVPATVDKVSGACPETVNICSNP